ncbi:unnamed protein product [Penicillium salamii]|uniref:Uncharacterized protein n=1 Tax=Penicillium salamii TaxID=1612424 RepID=A0A9W4N4Q1_9EURO|nr:unnamed protein product [Penicillium salamii]
MADISHGSMPEDTRRYRNLGAQYQKWIDDPSSKGCKVASATLTRERMLDQSPGSALWLMEEEFFTGAPKEDLEGGDPVSMNITPERVYVETIVTNKSKMMGLWLRNTYHHIMGPGIIIAANISRKCGPHWNEIAQALYDATFKIQTLRHIVFTDVVNLETARYVENELYPKCRNKSKRFCLELQYGTPEYQKILGTSLGKAAACLVLSSFPRGTMRISRALTWRSKYGSVTVRFDIIPAR